MIDISVEIESLEQVNLLAQRSILAREAYTQFMRGEKALVFCAPTHSTIVTDRMKHVQAFHSKLTAAIFNNEIEGSIPKEFDFENSIGETLKECCYLSSDLTRAEQKRIIQGFKDPNSNPRVLCTIDMLVEGFDFPSLKNMILLRPTLSPRLFIQQLGRVLRRSDTSRSARVIEISDDLTSTYELLTWDKMAISGDTTRVQAFLNLSPSERIALVVTEGNDFRIIQ